MRKQSPLLFFLLVLTCTVKAQVIDLAPSDYQNYRAVEGGSEKVSIDTHTPLNNLIQRLEKPWHFVETGKMYWIGYTDDMYSIAAHNDDAIRPLLNLIDTTKNEHAKYGAVYTLHLIGISRIIIGRFEESFTDKQARNALLSLLKYDDIGDDVMSLLVRDPWQSDVPKLISVIKQNPVAWYIVSSLNHYQPDNYPLDKQVPPEIGKLPFSYTSQRGDPKEYYESQLQSAIRSIYQSNYPSVHIDNKLLTIKKLWGEFEYGLDGITNGSSDNNIYKLLSLVVSNSPMDYGETGSKINYYVKDGKLYICSPEISRDIVIKWWDSQSIAYQQQFTQDSAKRWHVVH
jgi:hypothetical protein